MTAPNTFPIHDVTVIHTRVSPRRTRRAKRCSLINTTTGGSAYTPWDTICVGMCNEHGNIHSGSSSATTKHTAQTRHSVLAKTKRLALCGLPHQTAHHRRTLPSYCERTRYTGASCLQAIDRYWGLHVAHPLRWAWQPDGWCSIIAFARNQLNRTFLVIMRWCSKALRRLIG
jgi:hypothetical protein